MELQILSSEEHHQIYNQLVVGDDPYSFPVRGMLSFILSGRIKTGKVYVDKWPNFLNVACLQETLEYSKIDNDVLTVFSKDIESFKPFLLSLKFVRNWKNRGLLIMYLRADFVESAKSLMSNNDCKDLGSLIIYERPTGTELLRLHDKFVKAEMKKFPGYYLAPVAQEDITTIVDLYPSPIPAKVEMFSWMASNLPSISLHDDKGRLIAWCLTYSCGAGAVLYVKPEFRRHGFGIVVGVDLVVEQSKLYPGKQFGAISPGNHASIDLNRKVDAPRTDALANWLIFTQVDNTSKL